MKRLGVLYIFRYNHDMRKTFQFRLNPTHHQRTKLNQTLEICRWVYNETLATRKQAWEQEQQSLSLYATNKLLTSWKKDKPELAQVYSQVLQNVQERVDLAFQGFFRRVKAKENPGYPRFRGYGRYDSFTFKQSGFTRSENGLRLSKIGEIQIVQHRPMEGKVKTLTIRRDAVGNWYACFSCEVEPDPLPPCAKGIGIDVGLESFATFSTGEKVANPRFFRRDERQLAKAQRKLSWAERGTPERAKRRKAVCHIYQRIANRRKDFAHQLSRRLVNEFGIIALEKLNSQSMLHNHHLAKSISDAAWNQLAQYTHYKAEHAGRACVLVDPCNTSKQCSRCGTLVEKSLAVRVHECPVCGLLIDRDENAAINILALGLESLGGNRRSPTAFAVGE
jgi:putative transposase